MFAKRLAEKKSSFKNTSYQPITYFFANRNTTHHPLVKTYLADLPLGYEGEFGPGVKALVISLYYGGNMTMR